MRCDHPDCKGNEREFKNERALGIHYAKFHEGKVFKNDRPMKFTKTRTCKLCEKDVCCKNQFIPKEHYIEDCSWVKENLSENTLRHLSEKLPIYAIVKKFERHLESAIRELLEIYGIENKIEVQRKEAHIKRKADRFLPKQKSKQGTLRCEHPDCKESNKTFNNLKGLHIHEQMEHFGRKQGKSEITNPVCQMPNCNRTFETERALKVHFMQAHPEITVEWYAQNFRTSEWVSCPICGKEYYRTIGSQRTGKNPTCGNKECYLVFVDAEKRATCLEKYGKDHQWKVPEIHNQCHTPEADERFKQTCLERFGVDNPLKVPEWHHDGMILGFHHTEETKDLIGEKVYAKKDQILETIANRPGGRAAIIEKGQQTYEERTGYKCAFENPEVKEKWMKEYKEETGYDFPTQNPLVKEKILSHPNYISRKGKYKKGWYKSTKTGAWEHFDSSYEYIRFLQLDADTNIFYWHKNLSQRLKYQKYEVKTDSFHEADCIPDIFTVYIDSHIEVEELKGAELSINCWLKLDAIKKFCDENNMTMRYLRYDDVMTNEKWISIQEKFLAEYKREDWRKNSE